MLLVKLIFILSPLLANKSHLKYEIDEEFVTILTLKRIVHRRMKIPSLFTHPRVILAHIWNANLDVFDSQRAF